MMRVRLVIDRLGARTKVVFLPGRALADSCQCEHRCSPRHHCEGNILATDDTLNVRCKQLYANGWNLASWRHGELRPRYLYRHLYPFRPVILRDYLHCNNYRHCEE